MTTINKQAVVIPADWVAGPAQGHWTLQEYRAIPEDGKQYEVVNGVLYMTPSPNVGHQRITLEIAIALRNVVTTTGLGEVFIAPLDVELGPNNIVQPDVFVVLHEHADRILTNSIMGAPDLVVEVASPATARYDMRDKQDAYARAGVREYWIVNPEAGTVEVLHLVDRQYTSLGLFQGQTTLPSQIIPGITFLVEQFFR